MSDKIRWRYGDENHVKAAVHADTVIEIGDILYQDDDNAKPASDQADQLNLAINQGLLVCAFLGVAKQRSRNDDANPIRVATTGVFEFDCILSRPVELGDLMGVDEPESGIGLTNQTVAVVDACRRAIGRVTKREPVGATSVYVDIRSTVMTGGV